jgi:hypothetical protein
MCLLFVFPTKKTVQVVMSWDETAVFVAVKGWQDYYELETGNAVLMEGVNIWKPGGTNEAHLVEKMSPEQMRLIINQLMMHQPVKRESGKSGALVGG